MFTKMFFNKFYTFKTDFSILKLERKAKLSGKVGVICLPQSSSINLSGVELTVSGWGLTANSGKPSNVLKVGTVYEVPNAECQKKHGKSQVTDKMLCAAKKGTDACLGDSGGERL